MPQTAEELLYRILALMYREAIGPNWLPRHTQDVAALANAIVLVAEEAALAKVQNHVDDAPHTYPDGSTY